MSPKTSDLAFAAGPRGCRRARPAGRASWSSFVVKRVGRNGRVYACMAQPPEGHSDHLGRGAELLGDRRRRVALSDHAGHALAASTGGCEDTDAARAVGP